MSGFKEVVAGSTIKLKFISSGDTFSPIYVDVRNGDETLVHSATMASSGNGHYYYSYTVPTSSGFYSARMKGYVNSLAYIKPEWFRILPMEVD